MNMKNFPTKIDSKTSSLRIKVPENLDLALEGLIRKVLRDQPKTDDIYLFAANYFETLLKIRDKAGVKYMAGQICPFHNDEDAHEMIKLANTFPRPTPEKLNTSEDKRRKTSGKLVPQIAKKPIEKKENAEGKTRVKVNEERRKALNGKDEPKSVEDVGKVAEAVKKGIAVGKLIGDEKTKDFTAKSSEALKNMENSIKKESEGKMTNEAKEEKPKMEVIDEKSEDEAEKNEDRESANLSEGKSIRENIIDQKADAEIVETELPSEQNEQERRKDEREEDVTKGIEFSGDELCTVVDKFNVMPITDASRERESERNIEEDKERVDEPDELVESKKTEDEIKETGLVTEKKEQKTPNKEEISLKGKDNDQAERIEQKERDNQEENEMETAENETESLAEKSEKEDKTAEIVKDVGEVKESEKEEPKDRKEIEAEGNVNGEDAKNAKLVKEDSENRESISQLDLDSENSNKNGGTSAVEPLAPQGGSESEDIKLITEPATKDSTDEDQKSKGEGKSENSHETPADERKQKEEFLEKENVKVPETKTQPKDTSTKDDKKDGDECVTDGETKAEDEKVINKLPEEEETKEEENKLLEDKSKEETPSNEGDRKAENDSTTEKTPKTLKKEVEGVKNEIAGAEANLLAPNIKENVEDEKPTEVVDGNKENTIADKEIDTKGKEEEKMQGNAEAREGIEEEKILEPQKSEETPETKKEGELPKLKGVNETEGDKEEGEETKSLEGIKSNKTVKTDQLTESPEVIEEVKKSKEGKPENNQSLAKDGEKPLGDKDTEEEEVSKYEDKMKNEKEIEFKEKPIEGENVSPEKLTAIEQEERKEKSQLPEIGKPETEPKDAKTEKVETTQQVEEKIEEENKTKETQKPEEIEGKLDEIQEKSETELPTEKENHLEVKSTAKEEEAKMAEERGLEGKPETTETKLKEEDALLTKRKSETKAEDVTEEDKGRSLEPEEKDSKIDKSKLSQKEVDEEIQSEAKSKSEEEVITPKENVGDSETDQPPARPEATLTDSERKQESVDVQKEEVKEVAVKTTEIEVNTERKSKSDDLGKEEQQNPESSNDVVTEIGNGTPPQLAVEESKGEAMGEEELCRVVDKFSLVRLNEANETEKEVQEVIPGDKIQVKTITAHYYDFLKVPEIVTKEYKVHHTREEPQLVSSIPSLVTAEPPVTVVEEQTKEEKEPEPEEKEDEAIEDEKADDLMTVEKEDDEDDLGTISTPISVTLSELSLMTVSELFLDSERQHSSLLRECNIAQNKEETSEKPDETVDERKEIEEVIVKTVLPRALGAVPLQPREQEEINEETNTEVAEIIKDKKDEGEEDKPDGPSDDSNEPSDTSSSSKNGKSVDSDVPFLSVEVKTMIETQVLDDDEEEEEDESKVKDYQRQVLLTKDSADLEVEIKATIDVRDEESENGGNVVEADPVIPKENDDMETSEEKMKQANDGKSEMKNASTEEPGMDESSGSIGQADQIPRLDGSSCESDSTLSSAATEIKRTDSAKRNFTRSSTQNLLTTQSLDSCKRKPFVKTRSLSTFRQGVTDFEVWDKIEKELEEAATKIQSKFRGYATRKKLKREDAIQITTDESSRNTTPIEQEPKEQDEDQNQRSTGEFHDSIVLSIQPR